MLIINYLLFVCFLFFIHNTCADESVKDLINSHENDKNDNVLSHEDEAISDVTSSYEDDYYLYADDLDWDDLWSARDNETDRKTHAKSTLFDNLNLEQTDDSNEHLNEDDSNELLNYLNNPKHKLSSMASFEDYENEYEESNEDNKFRDEDNRELFDDDDDDDDEDDHYDIEDNDNNSKDDDSEDNEEPYASEKSDWSYTKYLQDKKTESFHAWQYSLIVAGLALVLAVILVVAIRLDKSAKARKRSYYTLKNEVGV